MYKIKDEYSNTSVSVFLPKRDKPIILDKNTSQQDLEICYNQKGNEKFIEKIGISKKSNKRKAE